MSDTLLWTVTVGLVVGLLVFEFFAHVRRPHAPSFKEAVGWSIFYIAIALAFGGALILWRDSETGAEYFLGYVTEKALSVDNLFVFLVIMSRFAVPPAYKQRVLMFGIVMALVLRGLFIWAGAAALAHYSWVFYLFGIFLLYTAVMVAREGADGHSEEYRENGAIRLVRRIFPVAPQYEGSKLFTRVGVKRAVTPLLLVMLAIGSTDVLFALDSIPAIFGITQDPFIVFAANAFALLGLRQLFFVVHGLLNRLIYLSQGLAVVLGFIAFKLVLEALHTNTLPFINGGHPVESAPHIGIGLSLAVILGTLALATAASLLVSRRRARREIAENGLQDEAGGERTPAQRRTS